MTTSTLTEVYVDELRDLYNCEQQLIKALPKMAKAASSEQLRNGFKEHLEQTKEHARRLEQLLQELAEPIKGKKCKGIEGIIAEGGEIISEDHGCSAHFRGATTRTLRDGRLRFGPRVCDFNGREQSSQPPGTNARRGERDRSETD